MPRDDQSPLRHLVVLGHPSPDSFNGSVARTYCDTVRECGQEAVLRDLYALDFDPLLKADERPDKADFEPRPDVAAELDLIRGSAAVVLVYPIWFGMPPAIIKGYVDRVLGAGFAASDIKAGATNELLAGKRLVLISSSASSRPWLHERGMVESLRQAWDTYLTTIFSMAKGEHLHSDVIVGDMKERFVLQLLIDVAQLARRTCATLLSEAHARQRDARSGANQGYG